MRKGWPLVTFSTAPIEIIDGDRGKNYPKHSDFSDSGHCAFLNTGNVTQSGFNFTSVQFITEAKDSALRNGKLVRGDVVMTTRGTIGNVAHFGANVPFDQMRINSGMVIFRCDRKHVLPEFLYHFLRSPRFHGQVNSLRSGVAQPQLPIRDIKRIELPLPHPTEQTRIAQLITNYDLAIENNERRMALLEESARLLYREWFVRLRFPGYEHTRVVDGVPEGWARLSLGDICTDARETVSPEKVEPDTPYIGLEHIPRRSISLSTWDRAAAVTSTKLRYKTGDIIFGKIRPYFHKVGTAFTDGVASSDAIVIRPNTDELRALVLMTVSSEEFVAEASQTAREGSKMPRADWKLMTQHQVALPPRGLLDNFSSNIEAITQQLRTLTFQKHKLQQARDLLLPRLMSGEIAV